MASVLSLRLRRQLLRPVAPRQPEDVVAALGAVQSQDFPGASWGIALRSRGLTEADVHRAFDEGRLLRTHLLRPTWHFVVPADIRWMLALTAPRVRTIVRNWGRAFELDARTFTRATHLIERALGGGAHLTRDEIAGVLATGRIQAAGPRLAALVMDAELEGVICSGPRRGPKFTYAPLATRAPAAAVLTRDESLAALAARYAASHGPATLRDFAWWSGLTMADARRGVEAARVEMLSTAAPPGRVAGAHFLLPNYDEYLVAYKDRGVIVDAADARPMGVFPASGFPHTIVLDGRVAGHWRRRLGASTVDVEFAWFAAPSDRQRRAISREARRYASFLGLSIRGSARRAVE